MVSNTSKKVVEGYCKLATLFAEYPDFTCLRKFAQLGNELLLYKQAELCHIEKKLETFRKAETDVFAKSWQSWQIEDAGDLLAEEKRKLFSDLEKKLCAYQEFVLRTAQFEALTRPCKLTTENLLDWLNRKNCGDEFLQGPEARPWNGDYLKDLICLSKQPDYLDCILMTLLAPGWHRVVERWKKPVDEEKGLGTEIWSYPLRHFVRLGNIFCVFASAAVPSLSVFGLFYVEDLLCRLVMITVFSLVFAAIVLLGFGCKRNDTFAATVAFAAVQVVFVQGVDNLQN